jgi:hypothetical protein
LRNKRPFDRSGSSAKLTNDIMDFMILSLVRISVSTTNTKASPCRNQMVGFFGINHGATTMPS